MSVESDSHGRGPPYVASPHLRAPGSVAKVKKQTFVFFWLTGPWPERIFQP